MIARADDATREGFLREGDIPFSMPRLLPGGVHIWWASLDQLGSRLRKFEQVLTSDEKARAERFRFEQDRNRFIAAHGILRDILGGYLGVGPNTIRFVYGENGKPGIAGKSGCGDIEFSLSHSGGIALYGVRLDHPIGVDIEYIRDIPEKEQIAEQFFSTRENAVFRSLPESKKREVFFNWWTRKEAFLKGIGDGLTRPLDSFDVSMAPEEAAPLLRIEGDSKRTSQWSIWELRPASGFAAAFATDGQIWRLDCWHWPKC
jgi:4'-phosphopantetheinyl transferase